MRIIRFLDGDNKVQIGAGYDAEAGTAELQSGDLYSGLSGTGSRVKVGKLLAPVEPRMIMCIGLNYKKHAEETNSPLPPFPILFIKNLSAASNPGDDIVIPKVCFDPPQVDWEVELAVVIGKKAKNVSKAEALSYVVGYTAANDVSARHWQKNGGGGQWNRGKGFDSFCPLGPELVTTDEIPDPQTLAVKCWVNGELKQDENTADMIFSVAELVSFLSEGTTLLPGTVILTGTPSGVGMGHNPPVYLKDGDEVKVEIEKIGSITNPVVAEK